MSKFKNKKLWKNIGIGCLAGALGIGAIAGLGALANKAEETTKIINPSYAVGGLTEQGQYLDTKESIYTKGAFGCIGLDIEIDFDNNISYQVFFYDNENDFLSSTPKLTSNYDETTTPFNATTARVVITPDDDSKISWYEINGYANQLTISVDKEQESGNWSKNLFVSKGFGLYETNGWKQLEEGNKQNGLLFGEDVSISSYNKLRVVVPMEIFNNSKTTFQLRNGNTIQTLDFDLIETTTEDNKIAFEIENISSFNTFRLYTDYTISTTLFNTIEIYGLSK